MNLPTLPDALGYIAALLTTGSFVPQALLTLRTRDVSGISRAMYGAFTLGVALWLCYGIALGEWPIILANAITLVLAGTVLVTKLRVDAGQARVQSLRRGDESP
jgi:MtN3 and saliva related transmembrane protein